MEKRGSYSFVAGFFSITIYFTLVIFIFSLLGKFETKAKQYTSQKNNFIVVSISEKKSIIKKKTVKKRSLKKSTKKKNIKKKKKAKKPKIKKSIKRTVKEKSLKSLFSGVNTNKYKKIKEKNVSKVIRENQNSRLLQKKNIVNDEKKSATKIVKSLSFENISAKSNKKTGEYNKYIGKISDVLDEKWQNTPGTIAGNQATVTVKIDKFGNFSYKIDSLSYNNEFNAKLQNFLENIKEEKFPPYKNGDYIELKVNFKDE